MDNSHFFDEEIEEAYWERMESKLPEKEMEFLRDLFDEGWNELKTKEKLAQIVENTQGLIDKRYLH